MSARNFSVCETAGVTIYSQEQASRWKRLLGFVRGDNIVETSRHPHHQRDIATNTYEQYGKTESPI